MKDAGSGRQVMIDRKGRGGSTPTQAIKHREKEREREREKTKKKLMKWMRA